MLNVLFAAILAVTTPSQPPIPSQAKGGQPQQTHATNEPSVGNQDNGAANNRVAAPNLTLSPEISIVTGGTASKAHKESTEDWPSWLLVIFTAGLFAAAFVTYLTIRHQANIMAGTLEQMKIDAVARAKEFETQIKLTNDQIKLARDEFNATHRPKIRVRQFRNASKKAGEDFEIHFVCANVGDSPCDILEISYQTHTRQILTAKGEIDRPVLVPGTFKNVLLHSDTNLAAGELCEFQTELFKLEWNMDKDWDFAGYIRYRDSRQIERFTGFWQRFNRLGFPVATPENPDFRYVD